MGNQILIVDDQAGIRLLLEEILKTEGYRTITAKTGKQACDLVNQHNLDLIIMDYNLPVMHGKDVLHYLQESDNSTPVVVITGDSKESVEKDINHSFVRDVVSKPFDIHHLKKMVEGVLSPST